MRKIDTNSSQSWTWRVALGALIGAAALGFALFGVDRAALGEVLGGVWWRWLALAAALDVLAFALRAAKWRVLLGAEQPVPYAAVFRTTVIGAFATDILPLRLDELLRAHLMGRRTGLARSRILGTIAVERTIDVGWLLLAAGALTVAAGQHLGPPPWLVTSAYVLGAMLLVALLGLTWVRRGGRLPLPGAAGQLADQLLGGVRSSGTRMAPAAAIGALEWLALLGMFAAVLAGCGANPALALLLLVTSFLVFAVPLSPGAVGIYHLAVAKALTAAGMHAPAALAVGVVAHATVLLPTTILGAIFLGVEGTTPRALFTAAATERASGEEDPMPVAGPEAIGVQA